MPRGDSVNDWTADVPQQYERWSCVVDHLLRAAPGSFLLQFDKSDAYRSVRLRGVEHHLTGFHVPRQGFLLQPQLPVRFQGERFPLAPVPVLVPAFAVAAPGNPGRRPARLGGRLHVGPVSVRHRRIGSVLLRRGRGAPLRFRPTRRQALSRAQSHLPGRRDRHGGTLALPPSKLSESPSACRQPWRPPTWSRLTVSASWVAWCTPRGSCLTRARSWVGSSLPCVLGRRALAPRRFPPRSQQGWTSACGLTCFVRGLARLCCA